MTLKGQGNSRWDNDELNREEDAHFLTTYLRKKHEVRKSSNTSAGAHVINVNAPWGHGKTFFLERFAADLSDPVDESELKYPVVFFNAWDNDYLEDPLISFIAAFEEQLSNYFAQQSHPEVNKFISSAKKLFKTSVPILLSIIARRLTGQWRIQYNQQRPHDSLGGFPPSVYAIKI